MAVSLVPGSATLFVTQNPSVGAPVIGATDVTFPIASRFVPPVRPVQCRTGRRDHRLVCGLAPSPVDRDKLGYYRGQSNTDGSAFYQRARHRLARSRLAATPLDRSARSSMASSLNDAPRSQPDPFFRAAFPRYPCLLTMVHRTRIR